MEITKEDFMEFAFLAGFSGLIMLLAPLLGLVMAKLLGIEIGFTQIACGMAIVIICIWTIMKRKDWDDEGEMLPAIFIYPPLLYMLAWDLLWGGYNEAILVSGTLALITSIVMAKNAREEKKSPA